MNLQQFLAIDSQSRFELSCRFSLRRQSVPSDDTRVISKNKGAHAAIALAPFSLCHAHEPAGSLRFVSEFDAAARDNCRFPLTQHLMSEMLAS